MLRRSFLAVLIAATACLPIGAQTKDKQISITGEIFTQIQKRNIKRLAICPRIISRDKSGENPAFIGDLGPLSERLASQVRDEIKRVNEQGGYNVEIVPDGAVRSALKGVKASDLYEESVQSKLRELTDAIILMYDNSEGSGDPANLQIQTEMLDVRKQNKTDEVINRSDTAQLSLSDAAYAGQSFIVRTVRDNLIKPASFKPTEGLTEESAFGVGVEWERIHYAQLEKSEQHPLQDQSNPFAFQIVVNGEPREVWFNPKEGNKAYVALDLDEEFTVHLNNHSGKTVLQSLLVDGVNSISQNPDIKQEKHHPLETAFARHWITKPVESYYPIEGYLREWSGKTGKSTSNSNRFKVILAVDSEAANAGIDDRFGLITVITYALRNDGYAEYTGKVPETLIASKGFDGFKIGIGAGVQAAKEVEGQTGERGVMLTAMTINYVDSKTLAKLKEGGTGEETTTTTTTTTGNNIPDPVNKAPGKSKTNGEEKQF